MRAQVEAFTSDEGDFPRCSAQLAPAILSSMSSSTVPASGTRSSASARHIRAMPSVVESPYWPRKTSINPGCASPRMSSISNSALREDMCRWPLDGACFSISAEMQSASLEKCWLRIAARRSWREFIRVSIDCFWAALKDSRLIALHQDRSFVGCHRNARHFAQIAGIYGPYRLT